jgi:hypothetical protein
VSSTTRRPSVFSRRVLQSSTRSLTRAWGFDERDKGGKKIGSCPTLSVYKRAEAEALAHLERSNIDGLLARVLPKQPEQGQLAGDRLARARRSALKRVHEREKD